LTIAAKQDPGDRRQLEQRDDGDGGQRAVKRGRPESSDHGRERLARAGIGYTRMTGRRLTRTLNLRLQFASTLIQGKQRRLARCPRGVI
jgi:hypothetical protein